MKAKILSPKQAEELGLKKPSIVGQSVVITKDSKDSPERIIEKQIIRENGEKELIFMSNERKAYFKNKGNFKDYIKQFNKIPKNVKKDLN